MKLSKKCQKEQTKFILNILLLIFTISTLLFPQSLSESQRNNLEAQLKRQAGKKTIVVEFYAPSNYTAQAYGRYIGAWIARNGYEIKNEDADGVGNFKITLYKPSKEELEQRKIAADKERKEIAKKREQEAKLKSKKEAEEREKIFAEDPIAAFSYAIYMSDFEMFKKYYYPYKEEIKKGRVYGAKDEIEKLKRYMEEARTSDRSAYDREKEIKEYQKEIEWQEKIIAAGDTNIFYPIKLVENNYYIDKYYRTINSAVYKKYDGSFKYPPPIYSDSDGYGKLPDILNILWEANDKFFYDAIEFLEKDGTFLWLYVYLLDIEPLSGLYNSYGKNNIIIYDDNIVIKHKDIDRLCYIIKKSTSVYFLLSEKYYYLGWFDYYVNLIPAIFSAIFNCKFENEEDALKIYNAFLYHYEKYKTWTDKYLPNYKSSLEEAFKNRKKS